MNDDLQKALAEILNKTTQGVEAGVGFLQRELPDVVQQLLVWHAVRSAVFCLFAFLIAGLLGYAAKRLWNWLSEEDDGSQIFAAFPAAFSLLFVFIALHQSDWLQILLAPKLYLIEYAASLVK